MDGGHKRKKEKSRDAAGLFIDAVGHRLLFGLAATDSQSVGEGHRVHFSNVKMSNCF
jgi:hypothetical protein